MNPLIRTDGGEETPAPGRWTIAPAQPVAIRTGRRWHPNRGTGRTSGGHLLITASGELSFKIIIDTASAPAGTVTGTLGTTTGPLSGVNRSTYQSISIELGRGGGSWWVDGELIVHRRIVPARSMLTYHGVYPSEARAIAWLGWQLLQVRVMSDGTIRVLRTTQSEGHNELAIPTPQVYPPLRLRLAADLTLDVPHRLIRPPARSTGTHQRTFRRPTKRNHETP